MLELLHVYGESKFLRVPEVLCLSISIRLKAFVELTVSTESKSENDSVNLHSSLHLTLVMAKRALILHGRTATSSY